MPAELAVVVVSHNCRRWLEPCLRTVYARAGGAALEVVVVDNASSDGSAEHVERCFPAATVIRAENRGFAYANNRGVEASTAPFVLFLNPDTEILDGTFAQLLQWMRAHGAVGLAGCRQVTPDGELYPTIRRFPSATRLLFEALGSERYPFRAPWLGERELDPAAYERETPCDWTSGPFMLARREAVLAAGGMDERYFLFCEEPDLCLGIKRAGWEVRHVPAMTILHHAGKAGWDARLAAQEAFARRQFFFKHLPRGRRWPAIGALALGHAIRAAVDRRQARRAASRAALRTVLGLAPSPFAR